jgi:hypothetical protein
MTSEWENQLQDYDFESPRNTYQNDPKVASWSEDEDEIYDKTLQYAPVKVRPSENNQNVLQTSGQAKDATN